MTDPQRQLQEAAVALSNLGWRPQTCPQCGGDGKLPGLRSVEQTADTVRAVVDYAACPGCLGVGKVWLP